MSIQSSPREERVRRSTDKAASTLLNRGKAVRSVLIVCGLFVFTLVLYTAVGVFRTEFGAYGDEGIHYVTGLMVRDFVLSPDRWADPMEFAKEYYLHFPKVGLGQWPPGFAILQTIWSIPFGDSRLSMLTMLTIMAVLLAFLVVRTALPRHGMTLSFLGGCLLLAAPLTQQHASMVMAEIPLAAVSFGAMLAFVRFLESERWADAIGFGVLTCAAILVKGNAWSLVVMTGFALLFTGRPRILTNVRFWTAAAIVGVLCVPYYLLTVRIVQQGMNTSEVLLPARYYINSLIMHTRFTAELYGYPLTAVAVWGAVSGWRAKDVLSRTATAYIVAVLLFHALVPTSVEPRKIFQLAPVVVLFIIAGLDAIVRAFPAGWQPRAAVCAAAVLLYGLSGFATLVPFAPGFGAMADRLVSMPYTRRTATLISSNAYMRDGEAGIIAEWMQRDRSPGTYLVRGTKLLATLSNNPAANAPMYRPISEDPEQIRQILRSVPIATVILHTEDYPHSYPHHAILRHALERHPEEWDRIYEDRRAVRGRLHELIVYRRRHNVEGIPIRLTVDLTRKIGQSVSTPHDTARSQEEDRR